MAYCPETAREDWIPPEERNEAWMRENLGPDTAHSFVYFPKRVLTTPEGLPVHVLELPVGVRLYQGTKPMDCKHVEDPESEDCVYCTQERWYSDYTLALGYARTLKTNVWVYETKRPLALVNWLDTRNLDTMVKILLRKVEELGDIDLRPKPYTEVYVPDPEPLAVLKKQGDKLKAFLEVIIESTYFSIDPAILARYWAPYQVERYTGSANIPSRNPPDPNPDDLARVSEEFGDQTKLFRYSMWHNDSEILKCIATCFPTLELDGYYAPRYQSWHHNTGEVCLGEQKRYYFSREIGLFGAKGHLRRVPDADLNGCVQQSKGGRRKRTVRNRKRHHKKQRQTKSKRSSS